MTRFATKISERNASLLLLILLPVDLTLLLLHIVTESLGRYTLAWLVTGVWQIIEIYQVAKMSAIAVLFAYLARSTRCSGYAAWVWVFIYLLVDEAFQIHQRLGDYIARSIDLAVHENFQVPARLYEVALLAIVVVIFAVTVRRAYIRGPFEFREMSKEMLLLIVLWAFFGFFTDLIAALGARTTLRFASDFIEDAGELVLVSTMLWYVFLVATRKGRPERFLRDFLRKSPATPTT